MNRNGLYMQIDPRDMEDRVSNLASSALNNWLSKSENETGVLVAESMKVISRSNASAQARVASADSKLRATASASECEEAMLYKLQRMVLLLGTSLPSCTVQHTKYDGKLNLASAHVADGQSSTTP